MAIFVQNSEALLGGASHFQTTHWSLVLEAGRGDSPQAAAALEKLCRTYWYPLYVYIRRKGNTPHDAQDLTQGFFAYLLQRNFFAELHREKGRFRSFILASVNNFLADARDKSAASKRGGGQTLIPLDADFETRYVLEQTAAQQPETAFDRRWALTVLEQAINRLREEHLAEGRTRQFERLKCFLSCESSPGEYDAAAEALGLSSTAVAVAVHRMRKRYFHFVREEIAQTVASPLDINEELNQLFDILSQ